MIFYQIVFVGAAVL